MPEREQTSRTVTAPASAGRGRRLLAEFTGTGLLVAVVVGPASPRPG